MFKIKCDIPLLLGLLVLCGGSLVVLWSAGGENTSLMFNQFIRMLVALLVMMVIAQIRPDSWFRWSPTIYTIGLIMLILVLLVGYTGKGAQRWLNLGVIRFQPSELMKIAVPMMIAWVLTRRTLPPSLTNLIYAFLVLLVPAALILIQPDLGLSLIHI